MRPFDDILASTRTDFYRLLVFMAFVIISGTAAAIYMVLRLNRIGEAAEEAKVWAEKILHVSPIMVSVYDLERQAVQFVSSHVMDIFGLTEGQMKSYSDLVPKFAHPEDVPIIFSHQERLRSLAEGESLDVTYRWRHKDGTYHYLLSRSSALKRNAAGVVTQIVSATTDISSLKQALNNLAAEKAKLERSNDELEQFATVAAHDLRSPLKSMHCWVDMLNRLVPKPRNEQIDEAIEFIKLNSQKADALIGDLLEVARVNVSTTHLERVDLNKTLRDILAVLKQAIAESDADIHCDPLPTVTGSSSQLESLFGNLIRNALTYRDKTRRPEILVRCRIMPDYYEFSIKDNGIGIQSEYTGRIFEMFKRLHNEREYPGTGIGLAYCKKVLELSGGKIWVNSVPGQGSTFYFTYPSNWEGKA